MNLGYIKQHFTIWIWFVPGCHSHRSPAVRRSGSVGWASLSTASLPTWSSWLLQLWQEKTEHVRVWKQSQRLPPTCSPSAKTHNTCRQLHQWISSTFCSLRLCVSVPEKPSVWVLTCSIFISAVRLHLVAQSIPNMKGMWDIHGFGEQVRNGHAVDKLTKYFWVWRGEREENVPFLDSDKVERHLSVGEGLLVQVAAVTSDERGHVVAWGEQTCTWTSGPSPISTKVNLNIYKPKKTFKLKLQYSKMSLMGLYICHDPGFSFGPFYGAFWQRLGVTFGCKHLLNSPLSTFPLIHVVQIWPNIWWLRVQPCL